jgi:hypothetical protein
MFFIENWRKAWRFYSVQVLMFIAAFSGVMLLPEFKDTMPAEWVRWIILASALAGVLLRIIDQPGVKPDADVPSRVDPVPGDTDPSAPGPASGV